MKGVRHVIACLTLHFFENQARQMHAPTQLQKTDSARKNIASAGGSAINEGSVVMSYRALGLSLRVCPLCVVPNIKIA